MLLLNVRLKVLQIIMVFSQMFVLICGILLEVIRFPLKNLFLMPIHFLHYMTQMRLLGLYNELIMSYAQNFSSVVYDTNEVIRPI